MLLFEIMLSVVLKVFLKRGHCLGELCNDSRICPQECIQSVCLKIFHLFEKKCVCDKGFVSKRLRVSTYSRSLL